jgi:hypothetical protein
MAGVVPPARAEGASEGVKDSRAAARRAILGWRRIEQRLVPIIGNGGVGALYGHSLALSRGKFPWLPLANESSRGQVEWTPLYLAFAGQPAWTSSSADAALQQTFHDVLASLVGGPLARRLLARSPDRAVEDIT